MPLYFCIDLKCSILKKMLVVVSLGCEIMGAVKKIVSHISIMNIYYFISRKNNMLFVCLLDDCPN